MSVTDSFLGRLWVVGDSGVLVFNGRMRRNTPPRSHANLPPRPGSANERSLPEIPDCWNEYGDPPNCRAAARGRSTRPVLAGRLQVRYARYQGRGARSMGAGEWP